LYEEFLRAGILPPSCEGLQPLLQAASTLLEISHHKRKAEHHKQSARMVDSLPVPLGWEVDDWQLVVASIRYHAGTLPEPHQRRFRRVPASRRRPLCLLAGMLRLARLLASENKVGIRAERTAETVRLLIEHAGQPVNATELALARQLLETASAVPVVVRFVPSEVRERRPLPRPRLIRGAR
jgi:exopolyphosphatase/pppGpp-phosphohydrolase